MLRDALDGDRPPIPTWDPLSRDVVCSALAARPGPEVAEGTRISSWLSRCAERVARLVVGGEARGLSLRSRAARLASWCAGIARSLRETLREAFSEASSEAFRGAQHETLRRWAGLESALTRLPGALLSRTTARSAALGFLVASNGCGVAARVDVSGVVRDGDTGQPVAGANVSSDGGQRTETDDDGRFSIALEEGRRRVTASGIGRRSATETVEVRRGASTQVTLHLFRELDLRALHARTRPLRLDRHGDAPEDAGWAFDVRTRPDDARVAHCASCHEADHVVHRPTEPLAWARPSPDAELLQATPAAVRQDGATRPGPNDVIAVDACARCHEVDGSGPHGGAPHVDEWRHAAMSGRSSEHGADEQDADEPWLRAGCARCHSTEGFLEWRRSGVDSRADVAAVAGSSITCVACHDGRDATSPAALRIFDTSDPIAGRTGEHLGAGAVCVSCHRAGVARDGAADMAPHAPQASLLVGRGARLVDPRWSDGRSGTAPTHGPHEVIADTCVRCHMARPDPADDGYGRVGGHTFAIRSDAARSEMSPAACASCHGDERPEVIGAGDWDGDGVSGTIGEEVDRSLASAEQRLRAAIGRAEVVDGCRAPRRAADVVEVDATLHLVGEDGTLLGDCDGDGAMDDGEVPVTSARLQARLADAAYDLSMIRADGSRGVHNPPYTFRVLSSVHAALR